MRRWRGSLVLGALLIPALLVWPAGRSAAQQAAGGAAGQETPAPQLQALTAEAHDMALVGYDDLQARSAYQPVIHHQGDRWIAYVGHHGGSARNPLTGDVQPNGTSVVDVTDPRAPRYLYHIPGMIGGPESGGAQMVAVCDGRDLPRGDPAKTYLLRTFGTTAHQVWDVTDPSQPSLLTVVVDGLTDTHKSWWECDTGIAYLVSGSPEWRTRRMTQVFDLSDPTAPRMIREFGLVGQEPGATGPVPPSLHGAIRAGNRLYFAYGTSRDGVIQIVDRDKLLNGDPAPTPANLRYPEISAVPMAPGRGAHTTFPVLGMPMPEFEHNAEGRTADFLVVVGEMIPNACQEFQQMVYFVDISVETTPFGVSNFHVPEASGNYCARGGRFGSHASNESTTPIYYGRLVFISYFNAGVRAVDIRDPYAPREVASFIPAVTANTDERCAEVDGEEQCKIAIQTNNVEVDDRGYIYIVDRANTGMHILELTGAARQIANFP
ncbi:MAG TPA: hypothetical protein VII06_01015 [Chloroflexota bacterium]